MPGATINQTTGNTETNNTPVGFSFGSTPTTGHVILALVAVKSNTNTVTSIKDNAGNLFTKIVTSSINEDIEIWIFTQLAGSGNNYVVNMGSYNGQWTPQFYDITGLTSTVADLTASNHGSGTAVALASSISPATNDFIIAAVSSSNNLTGLTAGPNMTFSSHLDTGGSSSTLGTEGSTNWPASTTTTASATIAPTSSWDEVVATFPTTVATVQNTMTLTGFMGFLNDPGTIP